FARAERLGLRDERLEWAISLTTKEGQVFNGNIHADTSKGPDGKERDDYIVMEEGAAPFRIPRSEVEKVNAGPGLRALAMSWLERYRKGEKPPQLTRVAGRKRMDEESSVPLRPEGAIFAP